MANLGQNPMIFQAGGTMEFTVGATDYVLYNVVGGTLQITPMFTTPVGYSHAGTPQLPRSGTKTPGSIQFTARFESPAALALYGLATAAHSSGVVPVWTDFTLTWSTHVGGAAAHSMSWATVWVAQAPVIKTGTGDGDGATDTLELVLHTNVDPTVT